MSDDDLTGQEGELGDQRWLQLLLDVALIANEAESLDGALATAMGRVCRHHGWYAAACHVLERTRGIWWLEPDSGLSERGIEAERVALARDWARQVMEAGRTQYIDDFTAPVESGFEVPGEAPSAGGAIATPLLVSERPVGAMVFFSRHPLSQHLGGARLMAAVDIVDSIGTQMGRVVERWHLSRRIAAETEKEHEALGRQIHDGIAQQLVGVKLLAQNLRRRMGPLSDGFADQWDLLIGSLVDAQDEARAVARGLSAGAILTRSETLVERLEDLCEAVEAGHGVECSLEVRGEISLDDALAGAHLLRIAREAVMNALRHGNPSRIDIDLTNGEENLVMEVRDNGSGLPAEANPSMGMGLLGMRYRAASVGGRIELESIPGEGTVVRCLL